MQDRFRFKIWDKFCETWLTDFAINQDGEINRFLNSQEALKRRFVLMQSTGLKDKNGKLIFEGDIVKINGWWNAGGPAGYSKNLCVVEFDEEVCGFTPMCNYDCDCDVYHEAKDCEVIGNIYENPELLEDNK